MANAIDVAAYIESKGFAGDKWKLQKLTYYAQAWTLAWTGRPLFESKIEAWKDGPVTRDLYREDTYYRNRGTGRLDASPENLSGAQRARIDAVLDFYGGYTGSQLSHLTHQEAPWKNARKDLPEGARSTEPISVKAIREFYTRETLMGKPGPIPPVGIWEPAYTSGLEGERQAIKWAGALEWLADK